MQTQLHSGPQDQLSQCAETSRHDGLPRTCAGSEACGTPEGWEGQGERTSGQFCGSMHHKITSCCRPLRTNVKKTGGAGRTAPQSKRALLQSEPRIVPLMNTGYTAHGRQLSRPQHRRREGGGGASKEGTMVHLLGMPKSPSNSEHFDCTFTQKRRVTNHEPLTQKKPTSTPVTRATGLYGQAGVPFWGDGGGDNRATPPDQPPLSLSVRQIRHDQKELGNAAGPNVSGSTAANGTESQVVWGRCLTKPRSPA